MLKCDKLPNSMTFGFGITMGFKYNVFLFQSKLKQFFFPVCNHSHPVLHFVEVEDLQTSFPAKPATPQ